MFWAKVFPDWGFNFRGERYSLNPGPWSYKEQMFSTIIFSVANGPGGTYYVVSIVTRAFAFFFLGQFSKCFIFRDF